MKIIHTADLHLGSPLTSLLSTDKRNERQKELFQRFLQLIDYGKENNVRLIIISGDMFDSPSRGNDVLFSQVEAAIRGASDIDFLYLRGNHDEMGVRDYYSAACERLPNLKLFSRDEWVVYHYDLMGGKRLSIYGREVAGDTLPKDFYETLKTSPNDFNIVALHGGVIDIGGSAFVKNSAPVFDLGILSTKYIGYLALGHLHQHKKARLGDFGTYCYSGCLEGRGFDELGRKGFVLLNIDEEKRVIKLKPILNCIRQVYSFDVRLTGTLRYDEVLEKIREALFDIPKESIVRVILKGFLSPDTVINTSALKAQLEGDYFFITVIDDTKVELDPHRYENDISLKGAFIKSVMADKDLKEIEKRDVIRLGLNALGL